MDVMSKHARKNPSIIVIMRIKFLFSFLALLITVYSYGQGSIPGKNKSFFGSAGFFEKFVQSNLYRSAGLENLARHRTQRPAPTEGDQSFS